jgi:very-short-patch-repair endonuclease
MHEWLTGRAKEMRKAPALYERRLWRLLRDRRLENLKFRRQVVIGRYIRRLRLPASSPHRRSRRPSQESRAANDAERDDWLTGQGFRVMRFPNSQIEHRPWEVMDAIIAASGRSAGKA